MALPYIIDICCGDSSGMIHETQPKKARLSANQFGIARAYKVEEIFSYGVNVELAVTKTSPFCFKGLAWVSILIYIAT